MASFQDHPNFQKGDINNVINYRPIANLCSTSKIFEKLVLNRLMQIQISNDIDLTHKSQHGFKKKHSTNTAGLLLQSILARALDDGKHCTNGVLGLEFCL